LKGQRGEGHRKKHQHFWGVKANTKNHKRPPEERSRRLILPRKGGAGEGEKNESKEKKPRQIAPRRNMDPSASQNKTTGGGRRDLTPGDEGGGILGEGGRFSAYLVWGVKLILVTFMEREI